MTVIGVQKYFPHNIPDLMKMMEALEQSGLYRPKLLNGENVQEWFERDEDAYIRYVLNIDGVTVGHVAARDKYPPKGLIDLFLQTLTLPEGKTVHEIRRLLLHPKYHRQGYGKALMNIVIDEIRERNGLPFLTVKSDSPAVQFYEKHGWENLEALQDNLNPTVYWNAMFADPYLIKEHNPRFK